MGGKWYSSEDEDYLERSVGIVPLRTMARKLGRTPFAVKCKLWRMGIPFSTGHGFLTANETARLYDSSPRHVITLIEKGYLKARQQRDGRRQFLIEPADAEAVAPLLRDMTMFKRGAHHSRTVLTEEKVREIHQLRGSLSYSKIAEHLGVTKAAVAQVAQGRTWKHLQPEKREWWERVAN